MVDVYKTNRGRHVLSLRVKHLLDLDQTTDVLCRALVHDTNDVDGWNPATLSRTRAEALLRDELAFGGYEAYGHMWGENVSGDTDAFYDHVKERVHELWPAL